MNDSSRIHPANTGSVLPPGIASLDALTRMTKNQPDLCVFSHLRWDFVFQRPQHLLTRFAKRQRVYYFEEPVYDSDIPVLEVKTRENGVQVIVPHVAPRCSEEQCINSQSKLFTDFLKKQGITDFTAWYYTPMALPFTRHLGATTVVYDCMDELSLFKNAHPMLMKYESELLTLADIVFTGGQNLYEYKQKNHHNIHAFPSSIDVTHFASARGGKLVEPGDQKSIARPRIGFFGVIDERMDIDLVGNVAKARPDWNLVILGPVVKIDPATLPRYPNIHYLGGKPYSDLPAYLAGWDVAMLPFAKNEATRFISPTKTPEYLAAGRPVVSTSIRDVVRPYGEQGMVHIADTAEEWVEAIEKALDGQKDDIHWMGKVENFLASNSWDKTWARMAALADQAISERIKMSAAKLLQA